MPLLYILADVIFQESSALLPTAMLLFFISGSTFSHFVILISKQPEQSERMTHVSSHIDVSSPRNKQILLKPTKKHTVYAS